MYYRPFSTKYSLHRVENGERSQVILICIQKDFNFVLLYRSLKFFLKDIFWPLCCLFFFDIRILITSLVSSNSSSETFQPPLWGSSWSDGSWIYNYQCNQCLSPLRLWIRIPLMARCTTLCDKVCQWLATGRWFSLGTPVCSTNKGDRHNITELLLKMALKTIDQTKPSNHYSFFFLCIKNGIYLWNSTMKISHFICQFEITDKNTLYIFVAGIFTIC